MTTRNEILERKLDEALRQREKWLDALDRAKAHLRDAQESLASTQAAVDAEFALANAIGKLLEEES